MKRRYQTILIAVVLAFISCTIWLTLLWLLLNAKKYCCENSWVLMISDLSMFIIPFIIVITSILASFWGKISKKVERVHIRAFVLGADIVYIIMMCLIGAVSLKGVSYEEGVAVSIELMLTFVVAVVWALISIVLFMNELNKKR